MRALAIIGAGPAGLAAAVTAKQSGLDVVVLERASIAGGQLLRADHAIGDVLGLPATDGVALSERLVAHARAERVELRFDRPVEHVTAIPGGFELSGELRARVVLLTTGTRARRLGIVGERVEEPIRALAPTLRGERVVIAGGGDEAVTSAVALARAGVRVSLVVRGPSLRARDRFALEARQDPNIEILLGERVAAIEPDRVELASGRVLSAVACFTRAGVEPWTPTLRPDPRRRADGAVEVDREMRTSVPGLFAAGDLTVTPAERYVSVAIAAGVLAARAIEADLTARPRTDTADS